MRHAMQRIDLAGRDVTQSFQVSFHSIFFLLLKGSFLHLYFDVWWIAFVDRTWTSFLFLCWSWNCSRNQRTKCIRCIWLSSRIGLFLFNSFDLFIFEKLTHFFVFFLKKTKARAKTDPSMEAFYTMPDGQVRIISYPFVSIR